jgi:PhzF family phenazine biosynthesis protein
MSLPLFIVDAFTDHPFAGNPAAVCLLDNPVSDQWQQHVAAEMNLSETAFLLDHPIGYGLRWFTPKVEVELCGHATLASAHVLYESGRVPAGKPIRFATLSGPLTVVRTADGLEMDFPARQGNPSSDPPDLAGVLGARPAFIGRNGMDYLVELESESIVRQLQPDLVRLAALPVRGVIVTAKGETAGFDFVSRFFAPKVGVPEDPVTGSAHCALGPYWSEKLGKRDLVGYQASARGGVVRVGVRGERVLLAGKAVTVLRGELLAPLEVARDEE